MFIGIILNEYNYALKILNEGFVGNKPSETLGILASYYRQCENLKDKELYNKLDEFMKNNYVGYNSVKWYSMLSRIVKKSDKHKLTQIDYIPITQNELMTIVSIKNLRLERLAFTLLCLSKFGNLKNKENNDWVNCKTKEIFKLAGLPTKIEQQCLMLNDLKHMDLITYSKKIDNININIQYLDNNSKEELKIDDFRQLGYEYMAWKGYSYVRCVKCGIIIKKRNNKIKYCRTCASEQNRANTLKKYFKK